MRISFITTIFNEEGTIERFLKSIMTQTTMPDEFVIVDGGSTDLTIEKIKDLNSKIKGFNISVKVLVKKGNRSVGRNEAIRNATGDIIVCSDAGNTLDKKWLENIVKPFSDPEVGVVAGYYKGITNTVFEKCVVPYVLVMPDKINPSTFLPATRSAAFRKSIWKKIGGFDESLSHNEDYAFAKKLQKMKVKIAFRQDAVAYWQPRSNLHDAYIMFFRFAYGDAEARIFRPKVLLIFLRYLAGIILAISAIMMQSYLLMGVIIISLLLYCIWAIKKNYRYVREWQAFFILPLLQFTADIAVMAGTVMGIFKVWDIKKTH